MNMKHDWNTKIYEICAETANEVAANIVALTAQLTTIVRTKAPGDFSTNIDLLSEAKSNAILQRHGFQDHEIISEESSKTTAELPERGWVVDPLDGTSAFIFGCGQHYPSVMVAYCENFTPVVAEIVFPFTGERFSAIRGRGARINGRLLKLQKESIEIADSWIVLNRFGDSRHETNFMTNADRALRSSTGAALVTTEVPHSGVSCRVAEGRMAAVIHDNSPVAPKQCVWDIAAPKLILEEAGGVCLDQFGRNYMIGSHQPMIAARSIDIAQAICNFGA